MSQGLEVAAKARSSRRANVAALDPFSRLLLRRISTVWAVARHVQCKR